MFVALPMDLVKACIVPYLYGKDLQRFLSTCKRCYYLFPLVSHVRQVFRPAPGECSCDSLLNAQRTYRYRYTPNGHHTQCRQRLSRCNSCDTTGPLWSKRPWALSKLITPPRIRCGICQGPVTKSMRGCLDCMVLRCHNQHCRMCGDSIGCNGRCICGAHR